MQKAIHQTVHQKMKMLALFIAAALILTLIFPLWPGEDESGVYASAGPLDPSTLDVRKDDETGSGELFWFTVESKASSSWNPADLTGTGITIKIKEDGVNESDPAKWKDYAAYYAEHYADMPSYLGVFEPEYGRIALTHGMTVRIEGLTPGTYRVREWNMGYETECFVCEEWRDSNDIGGIFCPGAESTVGHAHGNSTNKDAEGFTLVPGLITRVCFHNKPMLFGDGFLVDGSFNKYIEADSLPSYAKFTFSSRVLDEYSNPHPYAGDVFIWISDYEYPNDFNEVYFEIYGLRTFSTYRIEITENYPPNGWYSPSPPLILLVKTNGEYAVLDWAGGEGGNGITNVYSPTPMDFTLTGTKETNYGWPQPEFHFTAFCNETMESAYGVNNPYTGEIAFSPRFRFSSAGDYTIEVSESGTAPDGWTMDSPKTIRVKISDEDGELVAEQEDDLVFMNHKSPPGSLTIKKDLDGAYAVWGVGEDTEFHGRVKVVSGSDDAGNDLQGHYLSFSGPAADPGAYVYTYTGTDLSGGSVFTFSMDKKAVVDDVPAGWICEAEEIEGANYSADSTGPATILSAANAEISVTNQFWAHDTGVLTIHKQLDGSPGAWGVDDNMEFWARVYDENGAGGYEELLAFKSTPEAPGEYYCVGNRTTGDYLYYGQWLAEADVIDEIPFSKNQPVKLINLWSDTTYRVEEIGGGDIYTASYSLDSIDLNSTDEVTVTNTYDSYDHATAELIIYKDFEGDFGYAGVDGSTVFQARIWDVTNGNYLVFRPDPEGQGIYAGSFWCVGNHELLSDPDLIDAYGDDWDDPAGIQNLVELGVIIDSVPFSAAKPVRLSNLWADPNEYRVEEIDGDGYPVDPDMVGYEGNNAEVNEDEIAIVTVTNIFPTVGSPEPGSLKIEKTLAGSYADRGVGAGTVFTAKVKAGAGQYLKLTGMAPDYICAGADAIGTELTFSVDSPAYITGIPAGTVCTVEENAVANCSPSYPGNGAAIAPDTLSVVTVTNTYAALTKGSIMIRKVYADSDGTAFVFTLTESGVGPVNLSAPGITVAIGGYGAAAAIDLSAGKFSLADGAELTINGLDADKTYTVTETVPRGFAAPSVTVGAGVPTTRPSASVKPSTPAAALVFTNAKRGPGNDDGRGGDDPGTTDTTDNPPATEETGTTPDGDQWEETTDPGDEERITDNTTPTEDDFPPAGGSDRDTAPNPYVAGHTVTASENGSYLELNEFGVPLGEWRWDEAQEIWVYDEYPPLEEYLPRTGGGGVHALPIILLALSFPVFLFILKRDKAQKPGHVK